MIMHEQIISLFTNLEYIMTFGLWYSGVRGEGLYKDFWDYGKLFRTAYYKNGKLDGEYKEWSFRGALIYSRNYKNGVEI